MGMDPEARLAYGYDLGDRDEFRVAEIDEDGALTVDWYDDEAESGFEQELWNRLYARTPDAKPVEWDWQKEDVARNHWNVDIVHSGTHDYSGYVLTLPRGVAPERRPVNRHHPDCPYSHAALAEHCSVCQGIAKGDPS